MTDVAHLPEARRILRHLDDERRFAVYLALHEYPELERYDEEMARLFPVAAPSAPTRRPVGVLEVARGVKCCDSAVVAYWRKFRWHTLLYLAMVSVVAGKIISLGRPALLGILFVACALSWTGWFSMVRGKASVCH